MTMRYQALRTDDVALRERMKAIAHERRRFGYRRHTSSLETCWPAMASQSGAPAQP